jgi:hypothetical protein
MVAMDNRTGSERFERLERSERPDPMSALVDVIRAAQRMILARIDLATIQAKDTLQGVAMLMGAALVATFGWVLLMCGAVTLLDNFIPLPAAFAIVGGVHLAGGVVVALLAKARVEPGHNTLAENDDR